MFYNKNMFNFLTNKMKFENWRWKEHLTNKSIAEKLSVSGEYVSYLMRDLRKPSKEMMDKIRVLTNGKVSEKDFKRSKNK